MEDNLLHAKWMNEPAKESLWSSLQDGRDHADAKSFLYPVVAMPSTLLMAFIVSKDHGAMLPFWLPYLASSFANFFFPSKSRPQKPTRIYVRRKGKGVGADVGRLSIENGYLRWSGEQMHLRIASESARFAPPPPKILGVEAYAPSPSRLLLRDGTTLDFTTYGQTDFRTQLGEWLATPSEDDGEIFPPKERTLKAKLRGWAIATCALWILSPYFALFLNGAVADQRTRLLVTCLFWLVILTVSFSPIWRTTGYLARAD